MSEAANSSGHERYAGDVAAHALGALDDADVQPFEEHLAGCAQCRDRLASMREVIEALPAAAPVRWPPRELKERVMAIVRAEATERAGAGTRIARGGRAPIVPWPAWLNPRVSAAAGAIVAVLVILSVLTLGRGSATRTYLGVVHAPGASASLRESASGALLRVSRLPRPPAGRIYQVWLKRGARPLQATRVLFARSSGSVTVPESLRGVRALLVTAEPSPNGSRAPTRAPIIVVRLA